MTDGGTDAREQSPRGRDGSAGGGESVSGGSGMGGRGKLGVGAVRATDEEEGKGEQRRQGVAWVGRTGPGAAVTGR